MPLRCSKSAATVRTTGAIAPAANTLRSSAEAGAAVRLAKEVTMSNCRNGKDSKRTVFLLKSEEAQRGTKKYERGLDYTMRIYLALSVRTKEERLATLQAVSIEFRLNPAEIDYCKKSAMTATVAFGCSSISQ